MKYKYFLTVIIVGKNVMSTAGTITILSRVCKYILIALVQFYVQLC